jgi:TonB family protein
MVIKSQSLMKKFLKYSALFALGALAFTPLCAAIEAIKIEPTFIPSFSPVLLNRGVTEGKVALVIDVSEEGKLTDWLALGYTDPELVGYFVDALKGWEITPARLDGKPIAAQVELKLEVTAEGVVVSRTNQESLDSIVRSIAGNPLKYQRVSLRLLDHAPVLVSSVSPRYAQAAEKAGVRGKVQVRFYIDQQGKVRMPSIETGAQPYLAAQAVAAVREWKFEPPTSRGQPVLVAASQEFDFRSTK